MKTKYTYALRRSAQFRSGTVIYIPDQLDLVEDLENPKSWIGLAATTGRQIRFWVDHSHTHPFGGIWAQWRREG